MASINRLPRIIWVAVRPPIPPFSGSTSKSLCGIAALTALTAVDVVSFVEPEKKEESEKAFLAYWRERVAGCHWIPYGPRSGSLRALLARRFQFGTRLEGSALPGLLDKLEWDRPDRLVLFDDITLAPFVRRYGANAILSPHDCMSRMFRSHFRYSPPGPAAVRYLFQSRIARRYERAFYHRALLVHVITQRDRIWLEAINPEARYEVVPNADLLNPGISGTAPNAWDVLVWGDLRIGSIAKGAKAFLAAALSDRVGLGAVRLLVVGRAPVAEARKILGPGVLARVAYSPSLEDAEGALHHAKITVVPDAGGAGTKNRSVNILSSGKCLACLYPQMEGVEKTSDRGAINASSLFELAVKVKRALDDGAWIEYGRAAQAIFNREYGEEANRRLWVDMVARAVAVRDGLAR